MDVTAADGRLVVGVDGSPHSRQAVAWALVEAARRAAPVEVLHAFPVDFSWSDVHLLDAERIERVRSESEARTRSFVEEVRRSPDVAGVPGVPDVALDVTVVPGIPAEHLVERARGAALLVVGSRGRGAVRSTLLGSVALHCVARAECPVVVVHPDVRARDQRVVVGLDDSPAARVALLRGAEEARARGGALEVVVAVVPPDTWADLYAWQRPSLPDLLGAAQSGAERIVADVLGDAGDLEVRVDAEVGPADSVLVRRAGGAALLVLGNRSRSPVAGMVLGSVALRSVVHATCPVMVVHAPSPSAGAEPVPATASVPA